MAKTIEEKAKAYDEAIYRVKHFLTLIGVSPDDEPVDVAKRMSEYIFPELSESEDEKVRKRIKYFINATSKGELEKYAIIKEDAISWLEKQGEQKQKDEQNTNIEWGFDPITVDMHFDNLTLEQAERLKNALFGEQKPEWSEEDETTKNNISHIISQYDKISKRENQPCYYVGDCLLWMQNIKDRVQPQPKQEWSEEDEIWFKELELMALSFSNDDSYRKKFFDWLKSLKDRVQPKQEWSKEDEKKRKRIMHRLSIDGTINNKDLADINDWLKSLRPQNRWKPSDEQIEALESATENCAYSEYQDCLRELIEQLKKLKDKVMKAKDDKCCICGEQAVAYYPCIDPDIPSYPYCADHLEQAMIDTAKSVWSGDKDMLVIATYQAKEACKKYRKNKL